MSKGIVFILFVMWVMVISTSPVCSQNKKYDECKMFLFSTEIKELPTQKTVYEQYKICPPLTPKRFRRRVKMLWGIDIKDYPEDAVIYFNANLTLATKSQLIRGQEMVMSPSDELPLAPPLSDDTYSLYRQFLFFSDTSVYNQLKGSEYEYTDKVISHNRDFEAYKFGLLSYYNILTTIYHSTITSTHFLMSYIDRNFHPIYGFNGSRILHNMLYNPQTPLRIFDLKSNLLYLYTKEECKHRDLSITNNNKEKKKNDLSIRWYGVQITDTGMHSGSLETYIPWKNFSMPRSMAANLSFLLLKQKELNSYVIKYMSGQFDVLNYRSPVYRREDTQNALRDSIRTNNYYGHAILREFCENPEREMPTLEKVGTSFTGMVNKPNTLLYLEPYADSYDIDTIQPTETFKAYEMGYDDYYFVEVIKPVESPVAGPNGYAMILDRTETVYGYLRKSDVEEYTDMELLSQALVKLHKSLFFNITNITF